MDRKHILVKALLAAGGEISKFDPATVETSVKSTAGDLVTSADKASERVITEILGASYPDELVISEEASLGHELLNEPHLATLTGWVIDPIDGTNNFKRGMAYSGISIGYIQNGEIALGGIFDPYRGNLYVAATGHGATCNGQSIQVSSSSKFDAGTRVATSNSYEGGTGQNLERYAPLGHVWVDVLGSAVLIMADVAAGRLDLYHHNGLKPWDNAAGFLIAAEAGAKITGLEGQQVSWLSDEVVMGNPALVDRFLALTHKA